MEGIDCWWRGAVSGRGERSLVEGSGLKRWGAVSGGGAWSQVEGSDRWWRVAVSGGGERSLVAGNGLR